MGVSKKVTLAVILSVVEEFTALNIRKLYFDFAQYDNLLDLFRHPLRKACMVSRYR